MTTPKLLLASCPETDLQEKPVLEVALRLMKDTDNFSVAGEAKDEFFGALGPKDNFFTGWKGKVDQALLMLDRPILLTIKGGKVCDDEREYLDTVPRHRISPPIRHFNTLAEFENFVKTYAARARLAGKCYILSRGHEPLYRPADDVVCDKSDFGGDRKRIMALMWKGETLDDWSNKAKLTWTFRQIQGENDKYYILDHMNEPLYRPADDVVCDTSDFGGDRKRIMALLWRGTTLDDWSNKAKLTWTLRQIPGEKDTYYILSHMNEPLYRPADDVVCDKSDFGGDGKRIMALMWKGATLDDWSNKAKLTWTIRPAAES